MCVCVCVCVCVMKYVCNSSVCCCVYVSCQMLTQFTFSRTKV